MQTKLIRQTKTSGRARLLPADLSSCLGTRSLLTLCLDAVQHLDPEALTEARKHLPVGRPEMFITLLTYCYSVGLHDSRDIEWAVRHDRTIRYICAGQKPGWIDLRRFRRNNRQLIRDSLVFVMKQAWAFHFETGDADYVGYDWFESELVAELTESAISRLDLAALLDGADAD